MLRVLNFHRQWWRRLDHLDKGGLIVLWVFVIFIGGFLGTIVYGSNAGTKVLEQWRLEQQCYEVPGRTFLYEKTSGKSKGIRYLVTYHCKDGFYQKTIKVRR